MYLNELSFAGFAGSDARDETTGSGTRVVTFSIAHNEKHRSGDGETVTWVRVKTFGGWCDFAAGVRKGDNIFVKGKLEVQPYQDKDGNERTAVNLIPFVMGRVEREERADGDRQQQGGGGQQRQQQQQGQQRQGQQQGGGGGRQQQQGGGGQQRQQQQPAQSTRSAPPQDMDLDDIPF